ncbi:O-antigen polysaccharide polymerase Wzy [Vibrio splendidus]
MLALFLLLIVVIFSTIFYEILGEHLINNTSFLRGLWFVIYAFACVMSVRYSGYVSVFSIFLILSFVFNYGRIFLALFTNYEMEYTDLFFTTYIYKETQIELLQLVIFCLLASLFAFFLYYRKSKLSISHSPELMKVGSLLMLFSAVPLSFNYILEFRYIISHGYLSIFTGEMSRNTHTFLPTLFPRFFTIGFMLFLASIPPISKFKKMAFFYLVVIFLSALKGQRGEFFLNIIYIVWYFHSMYSVKFSLKKGLLIVSFLLVFSQLALFFRSGIEANILDVPYEFIRLNSISINVPIYLIQYKDELIRNGVPYIFAPIHDYFYRIFVDRAVFYAGPSPELLEVSNYLSYHLIHFVNETAFYMGNGTGTSYLAEVYDLGGLYFGSIVMFFLTLFALFWEKKAFSSRYFNFMSFIVLSQFMYMPRDAFFKIVDNIIIYSLIYLIVIYFIKLRKEKI